MGADVSAAQSTPLSLSPTQKLPAYCTTSKMTDVEFLQAIQKIIAHRELADAVFIEKILDTKFSVSYGWKADGRRDLQKKIYQSDQMLGTPVEVSLSVNASRKPLGGLIADLSLNGSQNIAPNSNFLSDCLRISANDFVSPFGTDVFRNVVVGDIPPRTGPYIPPPVIYNKVLHYPGIDKTRIELDVNYEANDQLISQVVISQYR
ncbi:MAG: hypothetical protein KGH75_07860 [Rhodospirillales bacterium]|nr:hypothetical protein [Rhodospirillales bacterium]